MISILSPVMSPTINNDAVQQYNYEVRVGDGLDEYNHFDKNVFVQTVFLVE